MTVNPSNSEPWTQSYLVGVVPGFTCPGVLFTFALSVAVDGTTYQYPQGQDVFTVPTGIITKADVFPQITLATATPGIVGVVRPF